MDWPSSKQRSQISTRGEQMNTRLLALIPSVSIAGACCARVRNVDEEAEDVALLDSPGEVGAAQSRSRP